MDALRIDKWLWAARFFKTRSIASDEIGKNRVQINGQDAKASREVKPGDTVRMRQGQVERTVLVKAISAVSIEQGRPTKRDRRQIEKTWDDRWSAGID